MEPQTEGLPFIQTGMNRRDAAVHIMASMHTSLCIAYGQVAAAMAEFTRCEPILEEHNPSIQQKRWHARWKAGYEHLRSNERTLRSEMDPRTMARRACDMIEALDHEVMRRALKPMEEDDDEGPGEHAGGD